MSSTDTPCVVTTGASARTCRRRAGTRSARGIQVGNHEVGLGVLDAQHLRSRIDLAALEVRGLDWLDAGRFSFASSGSRWDLPQSSEWLMIATRFVPGLVARNPTIAFADRVGRRDRLEDVGANRREIAALAAPSTMNGVFGLLASSGLIAITVPLHHPPWIMKTWSCEISFLVAAIVLFGSQASSSITSYDLAAIDAAGVVDALVDRRRPEQRQRADGGRPGEWAEHANLDRVLRDARSTLCARAGDTPSDIPNEIAAVR